MWSLGITAIEMAELRPPHAQIHPMRVLFKILRDPPPRLAKDENDWSETFRDFVAACTIKDHYLRKNAKAMLEHPFVKNAGTTAVLIAAIDECKDLLQRGGFTTADDAIRKQQAVEVEVPAPAGGMEDKRRSRYENAQQVGTIRGAPPLPASNEPSGTFRIRSSVDDISPQVQELDTNSMITRDNTITSTQTRRILESTPPPPDAIARRRYVSFMAPAPIRFIFVGVNRSCSDLVRE